MQRGETHPTCYARSPRRPRRDSNAQPADSKSDALSVELRGRLVYNESRIKSGFLG